MALFWTSIVVGVVIVALAIGIPYYITHRRLRPHDTAKAGDYLDARDEMAAAAAPEPAGPNICRECAGTGLTNGAECPVCGGTGKVADQVSGA